MCTKYVMIVLIISESPLNAHIQKVSIRFFLCYLIIFEAIIVVTWYFVVFILTE